jgi:hypothetical protein
MTRIVTSLHGQKIGLTQNGRLMVPAGFISGEHGSQIALPSPDRVSFFRDFDAAAQVYSTTVVDGMRSRKGTTNTVDWTVAAGGAVVGTIGDTTASMAVSGVQLDTGLNWKANQGELVFQARVKMSTIATIAVYIGLTDQVAALEMPINSAAGAHTITTNATDAVGFLFDTSDTSTDQWLAVGVANDVDATVQSGLGISSAAILPVADTYAVFRIEVATDGSAVFYYNGVQVGAKMAGAVTPTIALTPVIAAFNRTTSGTPTLTVDYLSVSALRV